MLGVIACACTARESEVVAGSLAFVAELPGRCPDQRMEPVDGAGDSAERVADEIVPLHVSQLVKQNRAPSVRAP